MKKRILVIYFTQSGQLKQVIDSVLKSVNEDNAIDVTFEELEPVEPYPFPWRDKFFDTFSDCVNELPCKLKPLKVDITEKYDLVIVGSQSWFLSPSVPINSFLLSEEAKKLLNGTPVITIHGVRNMWFSTQEIIKKRLVEANARLVGNIVLGDNHDNYISAITIIKWLVYGNKGPYKLLPVAGIEEKDIKNAVIFGDVIREAIINDKYNGLHQELLKKGAVRFRFNILIIELNAKKIFRKFGKFVNKKDKSDPAYYSRIKIFRGYLLFMLFGLSPIFSLLFMIVRVLFYPFTNGIVNYYKGIELKS